jgi:dienelactone hydrolase
MYLFRLALAAILIAAVCGRLDAASAETVTFQGDGVTLSGILLAPAGTGPFPAVVALHGCGGLYKKSGGLSQRHADWARRLVANGYVVLLPDSFGSRGAGSQCRTRDRVARAWRERVQDVLAAKAYLQRRSDVRANAISLLGWSNGGSTVLYAVQPRSAPHDGKPDFANAVAFYPGCRVPAKRGNWHTRLPLLILIGAADDWTPAAPCEALAKKAAAAGEKVSIKVYPSAYHDFDHPNLPIHINEHLAYTGSGTDRAHSGTNPAARQDAISRVMAFLSK